MTVTDKAPAEAGLTRPWPADQVERWPIERLIPYANNPRLHSEDDLDKIAASILKWGWTNPALVDENGTLIAGHGRVAAAAKLKLAAIPVIIARGWSEDEKQAYRLADNELAARASWDTDLLRDELRLLQFSGFDLDLIGFKPDRLQEILAGLGSSGLTESRQRPGSARSSRHSARRSVALERPPGLLWRQHQRGRCRAGAGGIAAAFDGHRSAIRCRLRPVVASTPRLRCRQARAGEGAQRRSR